MRPDRFCFGTMFDKISLAASPCERMSIRLLPVRTPFYLLEIFISQAERRSIAVYSFIESWSLTGLAEERKLVNIGFSYPKLANQSSSEWMTVFSVL